MVCLADPKVRRKARLDIKLMIEKRLTYRKELLLEDEVPPIPNVRRTPKELSRSPVYKRTKSMIPRKLNKILVNKHRQINTPDLKRRGNFSSAYTDSKHDFGYYNRAKRKESTTIRDLTDKLRETRKLLDVIRQSGTPPALESRPNKKPVRRKIAVEEGPRRAVPRIADFISADQSDAEAIHSLSDDSFSELIIPIENADKVSHSTPRNRDVGELGIEGDGSSDSEIRELHENMRKVVQGRKGAGRHDSEVSDNRHDSEVSDPFTDSEYMNISLHNEMEEAKGYDSDAFSMCSEKISLHEARNMLVESEIRFSEILESVDQSQESLVENERLTQQQINELDSIISEPSSVEDLRFDNADLVRYNLPLLKRSTETESTITEGSRPEVMRPSRELLDNRPSLNFAKGKKISDHDNKFVQPKPVKPKVANKPVKVDLDNYEKDLGEIENILFKYDEYRMEQEAKKTVTPKATENARTSPDAKNKSLPIAISATAQAKMSNAPPRLPAPKIHVKDTKSITTSGPKTIKKPLVKPKPERTKSSLSAQPVKNVAALSPPKTRSKILTPSTPETKAKVPSTPTTKAKVPITPATKANVPSTTKIKSPLQTFKPIVKIKPLLKPRIAPNYVVSAYAKTKPTTAAQSTVPRLSAVAKPTTAAQKILTSSPPKSTKILTSSPPKSTKILTSSPPKLFKISNERASQKKTGVADGPRPKNDVDQNINPTKMTIPKTLSKSPKSATNKIETSTPANDIKANVTKEQTDSDAVSFTVHTNGRPENSPVILPKPSKESPTRSSSSKLTEVTPTKVNLTNSKMSPTKGSPVKIATNKSPQSKDFPTKATKGSPSKISPPKTFPVKVKLSPAPSSSIFTKTPTPKSTTTRATPKVGTVTEDLKIVSPLEKASLPRKPSKLSPVRVTPPLQTSPPRKTPHTNANQAKENLTSVKTKVTVSEITLPSGTKRTSNLNPLKKEIKTPKMGVVVSKSHPVDQTGPKNMANKPRLITDKTGVEKSSHNPDTAPKVQKSTQKLSPTKTRDEKAMLEKPKVPSTSPKRGLNKREVTESKAKLIKPASIALKRTSPSRKQTVGDNTSGTGCRDTKATVDANKTKSTGNKHV